MPRWIGLLLVAISGVSPAHAYDGIGDCNKSQYTLFNPTPEECLRDFEPDHPDLTSNPFTIDAGHVELESTLFSYLRSAKDNDGTVEDRFGFISTDIRVGIFNNFEVGVEVEPFNIVNENVVGPNDEVHQGPDSVTLESKLNLFGNEDFDRPGATSLAILTTLDIPTVHNGVGEDHVEASIAFPLAMRFTKRTELEVMTKYDLIKSDGPGYHVEYFNSGSFGVDWTETTSTYFELATRLGAENPGDAVVILGLGGAYKPTNNFQLDAGVNIGLTGAADRFNPFLGAVKRF